MYNHNSSQNEPFSLSYDYIRLVAGEGGKLSMAVYLPPPTCLTKVKFWMFIPFISNYQNVKM